MTRARAACADQTTGTIHSFRRAWTLEPVCSFVDVPSFICVYFAPSPPCLMRHAHVALKPGHWPAAKRNFTEAQQKRVADGRGCGTSTPIPACAGALCGTVVPGKLYRVRATPSMSVRTNTATVLLTASAIRPTTVAQNPEGTYPYTQPPANRRPACRHSTPPKVRGAPGANSKRKGG